MMREARRVSVKSPGCWPCAPARMEFHLVTLARGDRIATPCSVSAQGGPLKSSQRPVAGRDRKHESSKFGLGETSKPKRGLGLARGAGRDRTAEWRFCRPLPYHLATAPEGEGSSLPALAFSRPIAAIPAARPASPRHCPSSPPKSGSLPWPGLSPRQTVRPSRSARWHG